MDIKQTSYTNFRMHLAEYLNDIISSNGVLRILWRGHEPCVLITEKQYQEFMKLRDIKIHTACTGTSNKSVHKNTQKTPPSLIYKSQPDLFQ